VLNSIPKPYLYASLALSAVMNILGVASIVGDFVTWAGFLADAINTYHEFLRDPILKALLHIWPATWPRVPSWTVDIFIIQSSFFLSYRLFMAFESEGNVNIFTSLELYQTWAQSFGGTLLIFLGGPLVLFFQLLRVRAKANREIRFAEIEADQGEAAEVQLEALGNTNLPLLSEEGWDALDKRQLAGLEYLRAANTTFKRLNFYYLCYLILLIVLLFLAYQATHVRVTLVSEFNAKA
jgi:hypothetical protein